jgi:hypothetical protein
MNIMDLALKEKDTNWAKNIFNIANKTQEKIEVEEFLNDVELKCKVLNNRTINMNQKIITGCKVITIYGIGKVLQIAETTYAVYYTIQLGEEQFKVVSEKEIIELI